MGLSAAGPNACPFLALAEDRDARSTSPDQAHRCYAQERPEQISLSHQRAYCLTREYAVCPWFLDWADRLAPRRVGPAVQPFIGRFGEPEEAPIGQQQLMLEPARSRSLHLAENAQDLELGTVSRARPAAGTAIAAGTGSGPAFIHADEVEEIDETGRLLGRERQAVGPGQPAGTAIALPLLDRVRRGVADLSGDGGDVEGTQRTVSLSERARIFGDRARNFGGRLQGPAWEPRRIEDDYPTLRTARGIPVIPPLILAVVALAIAALAILVVPGLLAPRPDEPGQSAGLPPASSTPSPSAVASAEPSSPTPAPSATPKRKFRGYTVKPGDTLSAIAERFGITLKQLRNANPKITDPSEIRVGQRIRIPLR